MKHYGYTQSVDDLVDKCRVIVASHAVSDAQRRGAERDIAAKNRQR